MAEAMLSARRLVKTHPGPLTVLDEVSLEVRAGEMLAIVGPSGSGKSTLLHLLGTLDRPTSGSLAVAGHEVSELSDKQLAALRARLIGFVFQQFHLLNGLSALDNVAEGLLYSAVPLSERRAAAAGALQRVGLAHRLEHRPSELSGGERQRVAIARAAVGDPRLVFADEPTGNLDTRAGQDVMELLTELNAAGAALVLITHDHQLAAGLPRRIGLRDGRIEFDTACRDAI